MVNPRKQAYGASLTGEPFLLFECRQVARLKQVGFGDKEIMSEVRGKNLFQYATEKSITKRSRAALNRVNALDEFLVASLAEKSSETAKGIVLYAIMKSNRLMYEFMTEVVRDRFANSGYLEKRDLNEFMITKREQREEVADWKDQTVQRLKNAILQILSEAGIRNKQTNQLSPPAMDPEVVRHIAQAGDGVFLAAMGINLT